MPIWIIGWRGPAPSFYRDAENIPRWKDGAGQLKWIADEAFYSPSSKWEQAGPIIDRAHIALDPLSSVRDWEGWEAKCYSETGTKDHMAGEWAVQTGPATLIAAMRAYVASKFGDEVDKP